MRILVTGGAGFIGSHFVDKMIEEGHKVFVLDTLQTGKKENINPKATFQNRSIEYIDKTLEHHQIDLIVHCAAQVNVRISLVKPCLDVKINVQNAVRMMEAIKKYGVKKVVFLSSGGAIYGDTNIIPTHEEVIPNPLSPYAISKWSFEKYLEFFKQQYGIDYCVLRLANVYGRRNHTSVISKFRNNFLCNLKTLVFGGDQTRDYIHVSDVVEAMKLAINLQGVYNVGTGIETSVNEVLEMVWKEFAVYPKNIKYLPASKGEVLRSCLDSSKLKKEGWEPKIKLEQGIIL